MCGISGILAPEVSRYRDTLKRMTERLIHRGPDSGGTVFYENCALGHRRLSIVDLHTGQQPMPSHDGTNCITFNGEIYGYNEIRNNLSDGFNFRTRSDTEVILALYEKYGNRLLHSLPGMFAFAIWNDTSQELFCARDRYGEKPFYYATGDNGEFIFASEIKSIIASGLIAPRLDRKSLSYFLKKLYVPVDRTIYENIHCLPPAHFLVWKNNSLTVRRYWSLPTPVDYISSDDAIEKFQMLLNSAVKKQLIADVEVGAFLSGGLDSSTIVSLIAEHQSKVKTISLSFGESSNELPYAREISKRYGTEHTEIFAGDYRLEDLLYTMSNVYDEPFADSSCIPMYILCSHASKELKVVLTGDGADELLAGYSYWYRPLYWGERASRENWLKVSMARLSALVLKKIYKNSTHRLILLRDGYNLLKSCSIPESHFEQNSYFNDSELTAFGLPCGVTSERPELYGGVDDAFRMDIADYLPGDILAKTDRASMANSLELRMPFLDIELSSFLISLPASLKIDSENDKLLLRRAFSGRWTDSVRIRSKQGFGAPIDDWLMKDGMKELVYDLLIASGKKLHHCFDRSSVQQIAGENSYRTWILLVLSLWMEEHSFVI